MVIAVTVLLTSLMLPAMSQLQEGAHRIVCSSNQRQLGQAMFMYARNHNDKLPSSKLLGQHPNRPQELMRAYDPETRGWDGWGLLYSQHYCASIECYYCPSHLGEHPMDRYYEEWQHPTGVPIYTNYHYSGDREWDTNKLRSLHRTSDLALATDGLRTASDFNHLTGMNILYADGSVRWYDGAEEIVDQLPEREISTQEEADRYVEIWHMVEFRK